ncbi:MAG: dephospho-CoA kinase [Planctomycetes bacterium B3_Pla]|nr:MAG: dephospho-CoA kinase [Planctomycetes bacterium B3_Pla]
MGNIERKPVIGIMGGIASGKSTVAAEFAKLGCKVIDADKIVHSLLERKSVREEISASFGRAVFDAAGKIDHKKLARTVFADADKLSRLNGIIHPLVLERAEQLMEQYSHQDQIKAIVLDMPLLVEVGWVERCDKLVFVACREDLRANRAEKMGFDKNQLKIRENFQISLDNKVDLADNTVENNSDLSALVRQIADILSDIMDNG